MILDTTTRKIQVVLGTAKTTNNLPVLVGWLDKSSQSEVSGLTSALTNGTSAVDIAPSPASLTRREIKTVSVYNKDTVTHIVTVLYNDNGATFEIVKPTLQVGDTLGYSIDDGWYVQDSNGARKTAPLSPSFLLAVANEAGLSQYLMPSKDGNYRDLYRSGWMPAWFNQQWGGSQWGLLPDGSVGCVATGNVQDDTYVGVSSASANYYSSQGFKVAETATYDAIWVKLYKVGNPTYNLTARIYSDTGGSPNAAIGSAATISAKIMTSKTDGEWYQITGLNVALTAGTQYHIVLSSLAAPDGTNYIIQKSTGNNKYPYGFRNIGTSVPAWTQQTTQALCFLVQAPTANSLLQSGGQFDYKLAFNGGSGSQINQSRALAQPLSNFISGDDFTMLHRGTYIASTNVLDCLYGLDHDRVTVTINGSGYPVLTIYRTDRTAYTITGTGSVTTGFHDVAFKIRVVGDGADYAYLYVDGASVGTPLTAQTFTFAKEFFTQGTARLGDGFGIIPAWTQDMQMTSLPSAQGWTWAGTGTEANCMSVAGGKLYQNANGYTSTQTGYYAKSIALNNATGWTVEWKGRVSYNTNTYVTSMNSGSVFFSIIDGTKRCEFVITEYFLSSGSASGVDFTIQGDFKSVEHVFTVCGKGSDYYLFIDGKLAIDGTGKMVITNAANQINFGDNNGNAGENSDVVWSYVKYYSGGMLLPVANAASCSEFAHWSGDKSVLLPYLYNSGSPVSVKQTCGVPRNYQYEAVVQEEERLGISFSPTTTSTTPVINDDLECYVIGNKINISHWDDFYNNTLGQNNYSYHYVDGAVLTSKVFIGMQYIASYDLPATLQTKNRTFTGLHKADVRVKVSSGTGTHYGQRRGVNIEAKS